MFSSERLELLEPGGYEIKIRPLVDATAALYRRGLSRTALCKKVFVVCVGLLLCFVH